MSVKRAYKSPVTLSKAKSLKRYYPLSLLLSLLLFGNLLTIQLSYAQDSTRVTVSQMRDTIKTTSTEIERINQERREIEKRLKKRERQMIEIERQKAQQGITGSNYYIMSYKVIEGDTVFIDQLPALFKFGKMQGKRKNQNWRQYRRLVYNFRKVYPYALQARTIIQEADSVLAVSNFTESQRNAYMEEYQKQLFKQFEKPLRRMSISQGRLLLKLIDRELGRTSFYIIREYRGRLAAGFWQTVAKIFGNDLKRPYDKFGEDRMVEDLILLYHSGGFDTLYYSVMSGDF